uniref:Uncharacterized protein n=1 Tax=Globodera pallida TaxID=36090 RepID=A0A183BX42_GLOPA
MSLRLILIALHLTSVNLQLANETVMERIRAVADEQQQAQNARKEAALQRIVGLARTLDDSNTLQQDAEDQESETPTNPTNRHPNNRRHNNNVPPPYGPKAMFKSLAAKENAAAVEHHHHHHNKQKAKRKFVKKKKERTIKLKEKAKEIAHGALLTAFDAVKLEKKEEREALKKALLKEMKKEENKELKKEENKEMKKEENKELKKEENKELKKEENKELKKEERNTNEKKLKSNFKKSPEKVNAKIGTNQREAGKDGQKVATVRVNAKQNVLNLLWTSVAIAREKLALKKANGEAANCLLEFLARTVGGAFAPFADSDKHSKHFLRELRNHQIAFLSGGYHRFWRSRGTNF